MRIFHLMQQAHSALFRAADRATRRAEGITASQSAVLFMLTQRDGCPISEISEHLRMGKSSLTALIDRMVQLGLVRREQDPRDKRVWNVFIEASGQKIVTRTSANVKDINARLLKPFNQEERAVIERFLKHVRENAHKIVTQSVAPETTETQHSQIHQTGAK